MDIIELCASPSNDEFKSVVGELAKMQFETSLRVLQKRYALDDATSANHFNSLLKSVENSVFGMDCQMYIFSFSMFSKIFIIFETNSSRLL